MYTIKGSQTSSAPVSTAINPDLAKKITVVSFSKKISDKARRAGVVCRGIVRYGQITFPVTMFESLKPEKKGARYLKMASIKSASANGDKYFNLIWLNRDVSEAIKTLFNMYLTDTVAKKEFKVQTEAEVIAEIKNRDLASYINDVVVKPATSAKQIAAGLIGHCTIKMDGATFYNCAVWNSKFGTPRVTPASIQNADGEYNEVYWLGEVASKRILELVISQCEQVEGGTTSTEETVDEEYETGVESSYAETADESLDEVLTHA